MNKRLLPVIISFVMFIIGLSVLSQQQVVAQCPTLNGFLVDACDDGTGDWEGVNEMVVFHTGPYEYDLNGLNMSFSSLATNEIDPLYEPTSGFCLTGCPAPITSLLATSAGAAVNNGFTVNPDRVDELNAINSSCNDLLVSPTSNVIPPDATVIVFSGGSCWPEPAPNAYFGYDFATYCGDGPIYVIFRNDCVGQGKFTNSNTTERTFSLSFGSVSDGCNSSTPCTDTYEVSYTPTSASDGIGIIVSGTGATTGTLEDQNCNPPGFIPATGESCEETPPDVSINVCPPVGTNLPITVNYMPEGGTLSWYEQATGGTAFATSDENSTSIVYTGSNTSVFVEALDVSPASCNPTCRVEVPINILPQASVDILFSPDLTNGVACADQNYTLTASSNENIVNFDWYIEAPDGTETSLAGPTENAIVDFVFDQTGDYYIFIEITDENGCNSSTDMTLEISSPPIAGFIVSDPTICEGQGVSLSNATATVDVNTTYEWTLTNTTTNTVLSSTDIDASFSAAELEVGIYDVELIATNSDDCSDTAITTSVFEVVALPNITVDANVTTDFTNCDSAFDYSAAVSPSGGTWSGGAFISSNGEFNPNGLAAGAYTITYTAGVLPCVSTADINITVTGGETVTLTQNTLDICETTNLNLNDYVASGTGNWLDDNNLPIDDSVPYNLPDIAAPTDINIPSTPTTLELTYVSDNATCGNSETLTLNVFPYPDASTDMINFNLCNTTATGGNASIDLDNFVVGTIGGEWGCSNCPANTIDAANIFNADGLPPDTYNLSYIVTAAAPCSNPASTSQTITITEPITTAGNDDEICGLIYELNATTSGPGNWNILNTPAGASAVFVDENDPQTNVTVTAFGDYEFYWTVQDDACTQESEVTITFSEQKDLVLTTGSLVLCTNDSAVTLSDFEDATSDAGTWEDENGNAITSFNPANIAAGETTQLTFTSGNGPCDDIEVLVVSVVEFTDVVLNDNSIFPCSSDGVIDLNDYVDASSANGIWLDGNITITTYDLSTAPTNTPIELVYTSGTADCEDQETLTITVQGANEVELTQNTLEVCNDQNTLSLNDYVASGNGNWTTGTNLIFGGNYDLTGVALDTPFDVYFAATGGSCADTDTLTITLSALNDVAIFPIALNVCQTDAPITLSDFETAGVGTWNNGIDEIEITTFDPSTATPNSTIALHFTSGNGNCDDTEILEVTIDGVDEVALTNETLSFCENAPSVSLNDYVASGTGTWSDGTNDNISNFDPSLQTIGSSIELYFTSDSDCADTDTLSISIETDNGVTLTQNTVTLCNIDAPVDLNDYVASGTGTWTNGPNTVTTFDPSNAALNTTTELTFSSGNGDCDATETLSITVEPYDEVALTTNEIDVCGNAEAVVLAAYENLGIGSWSDENGDAIITFLPSSATINTSLEFYFTSANLLCADADTLVVNVIPFNDITLTQPTLDVCSSDAILNLNDYVATGNGVWENAAGVEVTTFDPSTANLNIPTLLTFTSNTGNCDDAEQLVITTTQAADASTLAPNNPQLCNNDLPDNILTLDLNTLVVNDNSGVWTTDAPSSPIEAGNIFNAEGLPAGTYSITYTVQGTAPCGEESSSQTINVVECLANCTEDATTTAPAELCGLASETLDLNDLLVNGVTTLGGTWSSNDVTIIGNVFSAENLDGNYTITYTVAGSNGCPDVSTNQTVTVIAPPLAEINTPTIELCNISDNTSFDLSTLVIGNSNGTWACVEEPTAVSGTTFDATNLNVGTYTIEYNVAANAPCTAGTTVSHTISVNEPVTTTSNVTTCETNYVLSEPIPNMAGTWNVTGNLNADISNPAAVQPTVTFLDGIGDYEITWSSDNPDVCAELYILNIDYLAGSQPQAGADAIVCGSVYTLEGVADAGANTIWSYTGAGSAILDVNNPQTTVTVDTYGEYIFTLTLQDNNNCSVTDEVTIYFAPEPTANPNPSNTEPIAICGLNHFLFPYLLFPGSPDNILPWPANLNGMWTYSTDIVPAPTVTFSPDETTETVSVAVSEYGTYTFYWLLNDEGLTIDDECGLANGWTVTFYPPIVVDVITTCADDLATYDVTLTITGGAEPYNVNNNTIVGNVYTETLANSASGSYAVDDIGICSTININVQEDCNCDDIDAPTIDNTFNPNYCAGTNPPTINVIAENGFTYDWYDNTTGNFISSGDSFTPPLGSGNYAVQAVDNLTTCTSFFAPFDVFEIQTPDAPNLSNMIVCEGENIGNLATASSPLNVLHWEEINGLDAGTEVNFSPNVSAIGVYTYEVYEETADGCQGNIATFTLEIVENAVAPTLANASFCSDETIPIIATASNPNNTLFWSENGGNDTNSGTTFTPSVSDVGTYIYTIYENNADDCPSQIAVFNLEITNCACALEVSLAGNAFACSGDNITLNGILNDPNNELDHVEWISSGTQANGNSLDFVATETVTGCAAQSITYTLNAYCTNAPTEIASTATATVTYYPEPDATVSLSNDGCTLTATPTCAEFAIVGQNTLDFSGTQTVSFDVINDEAAGLGLNCTNTVNADFACSPTCNIVVTMPENAVACSGDIVSLSPQIDNPNNEIDHVEWVSSGTQISGDVSNYPATETVNGCEPLSIDYTFSIFCTNDPTTAAFVGTTTVTYYPSPIANYSLSNNGCTITANPTCPNYSIIGDNPIDFDGTETVSMTVINNDANGLGLACETNTFDATFVCDPTIVCPNITELTANNTEVCSDDVLTFQLTLDDETNLANTEWILNGSVVGNGTDLSVNAPIITTCEPQIFTYTANIYCASDINTIYASQNIDITVYPDFNPAFANIVTSCEELSTIEITCDNYIATPVQVEAPTAGTNEVIWNVTYDNPTACFSEIASTFFDCAGCPSVNFTLNNDTAVCSGNLPNFEAFETTIIINDSQNTFDSFQWFSDNALTIPVEINDVVSNTCETSDVTLYVGLICTLEPTPIFAGSLNVTIYPAFNPTFMTSTEGDCDVPQLTTSCDNYIITPIAVPTLAEASESGTSGIATYEITYDGSPNGTNCFIEPASVAYACGAACPVAIINQAAPSEICSEEMFILEVAITPATAILGVDYSVQWQLNGTDINDANNISYQVNTLNDNCEILTQDFSLVFTCLNPAGSPPQTIDAGAVNIYPLFDENFVTVTNTECEAPQIEVTCDTYEIVQTTTPPEPIETGSAGIAQWTVSNICFSEEFTATYTCPALPCPNIIAAASENVSICSDDILDIDAATGGVLYDDIEGTFVGFELFTDNLLQTPATQNDYQHSGSCEVEAFTLFIGMICSETNDPIPAGNVTVSVYPVPTTVTEVGGCSLEVQDNCGDVLVIEYLQADGTWAATVPNENPANGETADWQAYVLGADFTGDGLPNCFQSGTVIAVCAAVCPTVNTPLAEIVSLCDGDFPDFTAIEQNIDFSDPDNTFEGVLWFMDDALTEPLDLLAIAHSGSCEVETITIYAGLTCTDEIIPIAAGSLDIQIYPTPTSVTAVGGCSLEVQDNCGDLLVIEYLQIDGTWAATVPNENPVNDETTSWIAYVAGADFDNDGDPNCFQTGVVTAVCNEDCVPPATPTNILTNIEICDGETNTIPFEVGTPADVFVVWYNSSNEAVDTGNVFLATELDGYYALAYNVSDSCESVLPIFATLDALPLEDAGFSYFASPQPTLCIGDANVLPNNIDTPNGTFSSPDALTIDATTGEITLDQAGVFNITYTTSGQCPSDSTLSIIVTDCDSPCPIVTAALDETVQLCDGDLPDLTSLEQNISFDDPQNTFEGILWFMDVALTEPLDIVNIAHSGSCEVETITIFPALTCTGEIDGIAAGSLDIEIYPTPTSVTAVGGCSLEVQDNCGDLLVIEYLQADGTWTTTVPNSTPADGETAEWQAYVLGADFDGDGVPNCLQTGTITAICNDDCVPPLPPTALVDSLSICAGDTNTAAFEMNSDETIIWYNAAGVEVANGTTFVPTEVGVYQAVAVLTTDNTCVSDTTFAILESLENILSLELGENLTFCEGDEIILNAEISANANITWTSASGGFSSPNTATTNFTPSSTGDFMIYAIAENDCATSVSDSLLVTVLPNVILDISASSVLIEVGQEVQLTASGATDYFWQDDSSLSCLDCPNPVATPSQTTIYYVNSTDVNSCVTSDYITITVQDSKDTKMLVPNAFSPNNDGENDMFKPTYRGTLESYSFVVYNRWGKQMFATDDVTEGWDGIYKNKEQEIGVYVYSIQYKFVGEAADIKSGNVTLVR